MDDLTHGLILDVMVDIPPVGFFPWETSTESCHEENKIRETPGERKHKVIKREESQSLHTGICKVQDLHDGAPESSVPLRQVSLSRLSEHPLLLEYLTELEWITREGYSFTNKTYLKEKTEKISLQHTESPQNNLLYISCPVHELGVCYSVVDIFHCSKHFTKKADSKSPQKIILDTVVCVPRMAQNSSTCDSQSFQMFSIEGLEQALKTKYLDNQRPGILSSCYPVSHDSLDYLPTLHSESLLFFSQPSALSQSTNFLSNDLKKFNDKKESSAQLYSLLVSHVQYDSLSKFMKSLKISDTYKGVASPISPFMVDPLVQSQQQGVSFRNGIQPMHIPRNRAPYCFFHHKLLSPTTNSKDGWFWDKSEPLGYPALCSCINEDLYQFWEHELQIHNHVCKSHDSTQETTVSQSFAGLSSVEWSAVFERHDFSSFFTDIIQHQTDSAHSSQVKQNGSQYTSMLDLRFCSICGGLTYIPFSFIEFSLNEETPTLQDLALKLPLPLSTELFCDGGLRVTACLVTRCRLHEWLALKALSYINMDSTVRVYQVCSFFIFPFHHLEKLQVHGTQQADRSTSTLSSTPFSLPKRFAMCSRHNLFYHLPLQMFKENESSRLTLMQHRRPYCLFRRPGLKEIDFGPYKFQSSFEEPLKNACVAWLKSRCAINSCLSKSSDLSVKAKISST